MEVVEKLFSGGHHPKVISSWLWISLEVVDRLIPYHEVGEPESVFLLFSCPFDERQNVFSNLILKLQNIGLVVVDTLHSLVSKGDKVFEPKSGRDFVPELNELVEERIKLVLFGA